MEQLAIKETELSKQKTIVKELEEKLQLLDTKAGVNQPLTIPKLPLLYSQAKRNEESLKQPEQFIQLADSQNESTNADSFTIELDKPANVFSDSSILKTEKSDVLTISGLDIKKRSEVTMPSGGISGKRFNAKYMCKSCGESWKSKNTSHLRAICKNRHCRKTLNAYKFEVINKLVVYMCASCSNKVKKAKASSEVKEAPLCKICLKDMIVFNVKDLWQKRRMLGHFFCDGCHNEWKSEYAWDGVGQECRLCQVMILPHTLEPLKPSTLSVGEKPHRQDFCEMCQQLGQNCKTYIPPEIDVAEIDEIPFEEDDLHVNTSMISFEEADSAYVDGSTIDNRTPINSDEDPLSA